MEKEGWLLVKRIEEYSRVTGGGVTIEKEGWLKVKKIGSI